MRIYARRQQSARQLLLAARLVVLGHYVGAALRDGAYQAFVPKNLDGAPGGASGYPVLAHEVGLGRQRLAGYQLSPLDLPAQDVGDLGIQRLGVPAIDLGPHLANATTCRN